MPFWLALAGILAVGCGRISFDPWNDGGVRDASLDGITDGPTAAFDDFNRPDSSTVGPNWTTVGGALARLPAVSAGRATCCATVANDESTALWVTDFAADQFSQITLIGTSDDVLGAIVRGSTTDDTLYFCGMDMNNFGDRRVRIVRWLSHTAVTLATGTATLVSGDVVRLAILGTTLTCSLNGAAVLTTADPNIPEGRSGFFVLSAATGGAAVDDWSGGRL